MPQRFLALALALALLLLCLALPGIAAAAEARPAANPGGYIDWERQVAVGVGAAPAPRNAAGATQARAMAQRAAMLDARRNLLEVIGQVRVDSASVVQNFMTVSDRVTITVQGLLAGATVAAERQLPDGTYEVTLTAPLAGPLTQEVLAAARPRPAPEAPVPATAPPIPPASPAPAAPAPQQAPPPAPAEPAPPAPQAAEAAPVAAAPVPAIAVPAGLAKAFTGLVVDARGTEFAPSLKPGLFAGKEQLYPGPAVDQTLAVRRGLVRYYRDLAKAQQSREVGSAPKTVKAAAGRPGTLDLAPDDAALLRAVLAQPGNFLDACKVVVVF